MRTFLISVTITWPSQQRPTLQLKPFPVWVSHCHMTPYFSCPVVFLPGCWWFTVCPPLSAQTPTRHLPKASQNLICACLFFGFIGEVSLGHTFSKCTPKSLSDTTGERENICWQPPSAYPVISNLTLCCCMSHPAHCNASGPPAAAFNHSIHMRDCFRGSSLARLLWLVNVCLFIA